MTQTQKDKLQAIMTRGATGTLIDALLTIEADATPFDPSNPEPTQTRNMVRSWIIQELEKRHPAADAAVQHAFDVAGVDDDVDYVDVLVRAVLADMPARTRANTVAALPGKFRAPLLAAMAEQAFH